MKAAGVRRLIVVSSFGVGDSGRDAGILERVFFALVVRGAYADKDLQEQTVRESGLDYADRNAFLGAALANQLADDRQAGGDADTLTCNLTASGSSITVIASTSASPARTARSASSSCASG